MPSGNGAIRNGFMKPKKIASSLLTSAVRRLPWGGQQAVIAALYPEFGKQFGFLSNLAQMSGIDGFLVNGDYGWIQGSSRDQAVLRMYAEKRRFAEETNELLTAFFRESEAPGTYVDVGGNIGLTTIPVSQLRHVSCVTIEPEPTNFFHLQENVRRNCAHRNVRAVNMAVYKQPGELQFEIAATNMGDHRLHFARSAGAQEEHLRSVIKVKADTLDRIVGSQISRLAVKIDVQGAEPFVFEGGTHTLAKAELLVLEFWPYSMSRMAANPEVIFESLTKNFRWLATAAGDTSAMSARRPAADVVTDLRAYALKHAADAYDYLDVVGWK